MLSRTRLLSRSINTNLIKFSITIINTRLYKTCIDDINSSIDNNNFNTEYDYSKYVNNLNRSRLIKLLCYDNSLASHLKYDVDYYIKILLVKNNILNIKFLHTIDKTIYEYIIDRNSLLELYISYFEQEIKIGNILPNNNTEFTKSSIELLNNNPLNISKINNINTDIINHAKKLNFDIKKCIANIKKH